MNQRISPKAIVSEYRDIYEDQRPLSKAEVLYALKKIGPQLFRRMDSDSKMDMLRKIDARL